MANDMVFDTIQKFCRSKRNETRHSQQTSLYVCSGQIDVHCNALNFCNDVGLGFNEFINLRILSQLSFVWIKFVRTMFTRWHRLHICICSIDQCYKCKSKAFQHKYPTISIYFLCFIDFFCVRRNKFRKKKNKNK